MTYEYVCTACGHAWEAEQSISEAALKACPNCHEQTARRQISGGAGFILKGGGWYADLYGSSPKKSGGDEKKSGGDDSKSAKTEGSSSDGGSKKDGTSSDKGSSGSSGSSSSSSGTPTSSTPSGSKATSAASGT